MYEVTITGEGESRELEYEKALIVGVSGDVLDNTICTSMEVTENLRTNDLLCEFLATAKHVKVELEQIRGAMTWSEFLDALKELESGFVEPPDLDPEDQ